jgi:hypothetical protein
MVCSRLSRDAFGGIAAAVKRYPGRHGASPSAFGFDFVSEHEVHL